MTVYHVEGPDGTVHAFEGPAGAKPEQVVAIAQQQFGAAPRAPAQQSPASRAFAAGAAKGQQTSPMSAFIEQAANQATFGQMDKIVGGVGALMGEDYDTERAYVGGQLQGSAAAHPVAGTAGGVVGGTVLGAPLVKGAFAIAKAVPVLGRGAAALENSLSAITRDKAGVPLAIGHQVGNVLKSAAANGAVGTGVALAQGQPLPQAAQTGAITAAVGPSAGKVVEFAGTKMLPAARQAWVITAKALGVSPKVMEDALTTSRLATGSQMSLAQVADLHQQGALRGLADKRPIIQEAAVNAANAGNAPLHQQLAAVQPNARGQTFDALRQDRNNTMNMEMSYPGPTGVPLRDTPVNLDPKDKMLLQDPLIISALRPDARLAGSAFAPGGDVIVNKIDNNQLTLNDMDVIRRTLRDNQDAHAGTETSAGNPTLMRAFGDAAHAVENLAVAKNKDYGDALSRYKAASRYAAAFQHGVQGGAVDNPPRRDTLLSAALKSPEGKAGYDHGNTLFRAQQALRQISPGSVSAPDENTVAHTAHAIAASLAPISTAAKAYHALRALPGLRMPDSAQRVIATQLFSRNPQVVKSALANLQRGGADAVSLRRLATAAGLHGSGSAAQYLSGE